MGAWGDTIKVDTVSDVGVEVSVYTSEGRIERVSIVGSTSARGSHQAVEEAFSRAGATLSEDEVRSLGAWLWEPGEAAGEENAFVPERVS